MNKYKYLIIDRVMGGSYIYTGNEIAKLKRIADIGEIFLFNLQFRTTYQDGQWVPIKKLSWIHKIR